MGGDPLGAMLVVESIVTVVGVFFPPSGLAPLAADFVAGQEGRIRVPPEEGLLVPGPMSTPPPAPLREGLRDGVGHGLDVYLVAGEGNGALA